MSNSPIVGNHIANFTVGACINTPPVASSDCPISINEDDILNCTIGSDPNNDSLSYVLEFSPSVLFNVNSQGQVYKVLDGFDIGYYDYNVTVYDDSGCSNNMNFARYSITVNNTGNHPPYLVEPIPDQTWKQDSTLVAFDLDSYFDDIDGDILEYDHTSVSNIQVTISSNNIVTFIPADGFYGREYIRFTAFDPSNESAESNLVTLEVQKEEEEEEEEEAESGKTSSAPAGGGAMPSIGGAMQISCFPVWECEDWSKCYPQGIQIRECIDTEGCNISLYKPNTTQSCDYTPTCFDNIKNGLEEGVDCGGTCAKECEKDEEEKELSKSDIEECEGDECKSKAHEESPTEIDTELLSRIGIIIALILASAITIYNSIKYRRDLKRFYKKIKKSLKKKPAAAASQDTPLNMLDKLELKLTETKNEIALAKLTGIIKRHITSLLNIEESITNEDLIDLLPKLQIDSRLKGNLRELLKELNEFEYSMANSLSKTAVQARIYEARNIFLLTSPKTVQVNYNKLVSLEENTPKNDAFSMIIDMHVDMINNNIEKAKSSYKDLYDKMHSEKLNDRALVSSTIRAHNLLRYCDEKR